MLMHGGGGGEMGRLCNTTLGLTVLLYTSQHPSPLDIFVFRIRWCVLRNTNSKQLNATVHCISHTLVHMMER